RLVFPFVDAAELADALGGCGGVAHAGAVRPRTLGLHGGARAPAWTDGVLRLRRFRKHAHSGNHSSVRGRALPLLHFLPWRTGAAAAGCGSSDFVLSDGFAGRRAGRDYRCTLGSACLPFLSGTADRASGLRAAGGDLPVGRKDLEIGSLAAASGGLR